MNNNINDREMNYIIEELTNFTRSTFDLVKPLIVRNREVNLNVYFYNNCTNMDIYGCTSINNINIYISAIIYHKLTEYHSYNIDSLINTCKNELLFTILHELYHVEQFIMIDSYNDIPNYNIQIENQVDYMTCIFIQQHTRYLEDNLNLKINDNYINYYLNKSNNSSLYNRFNTLNYYRQLLEYIVPSNNQELYKLVSDKLELDDQSTINIYYNGNIYNIKDKDIFNNNFYQFDSIISDMNLVRNMINTLSYSNNIGIDMNNKNYISSSIYHYELTNVILIEITITRPIIPVLNKMNINDDKNRYYI